MGRLGEGEGKEGGELTRTLQLTFSFSPSPCWYPINPDPHCLQQVRFRYCLRGHHHRSLLRKGSPRGRYVLLPSLPPLDLLAFLSSPLNSPRPLFLTLHFFDYATSFPIAGFTKYEMEEDVTKDLVEFALANAIFAALVEGHAAEISARRTAMENASKVRASSGFGGIWLEERRGGRTRD